MRVIVVAQASPSSLEFKIKEALRTLKPTETVTDIKYVLTPASYNQYITAMIHIENRTTI